MICVTTLERGNVGCGRNFIPTLCAGIHAKQALTVLTPVAGNMAVHSRVVSAAPEY
ncbi:MAG: hypothetical protein J7L16_00565 [Deltaproteobacteria bacterium]|nr:hypothetical protein [Deltaproteobacteria bacterium]